MLLPPDAGAPLADPAPAAAPRPMLDLRMGEAGRAWGVSLPEGVVAISSSACCRVYEVHGNTFWAGR